MLSSCLLRQRVVWLAVLLSFAAAANAAPDAASLSGKRVVILGDSITQDGRWVAFLEYALLRAEPRVTCDLISVGLSSETASGLTEKSHPYPRPCVHERVERALTLTKPAIVFACYGMNDGVYHPASAERRAAFAAGIEKLADRVHTAGASLVLITPPVFDPVPVPAKLAAPDATEFGYGKYFPKYDDVLAEFAAWEVANAGPRFAVIDLHTAMAQALVEQRKGVATFTFSRDGVHPHDAGHLVMARAVAVGLGLKVPDEPLDASLERISRDPLFALVKERRTVRSEGWLAYIGYTRGQTVHREGIDDVETKVAELTAKITALLAPASPAVGAR